jgi:hypothetical protein
MFFGESLNVLVLVTRSNRLMRRFLNIKSILCTLWLLASAGGFLVILNHQNLFGARSATTGHFPLHSQLTLDPNRSTLIMFAHPQCPCSRASVEELNRLLARCEGKVAAHVWFFKPDAFSPDWARADLWKSASRIPGVTVREDRNGAEARLFGATTSGYVLLYDSRGELLFKGGITGSRGHAGDNAGEAAIASLLMGKDSSLRETPVYGCALLSECKPPGQGFSL